MAVDFRISLLVRRHANGSVSVLPLGFEDLECWGLELEALLDDLQLAISDRLERSHPKRLHRFHAPYGRELETLDCPSVLTLVDLQRPNPQRIDLVLEPESHSVRVWIPRLDARLWVSDGNGVEEAVHALLAKLLENATPNQSLQLRHEHGMELVELPLSVELAGLEPFTGEHVGRELLPERVPPEEKKEAEEEKKRVKTPTLERLAFELDGPVAHGRDDILDTLTRMVEQPGCVVVVGPAGCGKTAVLTELARRLPDERIGWYCDASRLVANGSWREQAMQIAEEVAKSKAVWFCGDPIQLLDAGKSVGSEMNAAQLLKPYLSAGQVRVVGECSEQSWAKLEAKDAGFARLFAVVRLTEPEVHEVPAILSAIAAGLKVPITADATTATLELARRYGPAEALLGTAARFLRRMTAEARARGEKGPLDRNAVIRRFCKESGMPEILVRDEAVLDPQDVRDVLQSRVIGQADAVERLVELVAVIKGGMSDLGRPLGSFLFVGPTGVGKTESAKALAHWMFGASDRIVRFDMSEFSGPDCLVRLLDPSAGLVARVRTQPFCVVLLDEIEKAHDAVFDLLLQVLGEARLSDAAGTTADFRNTVVLLTSNLGVGTFKRPTGFGKDLSDELRGHVLREVERFFRPELFNRIDRVVPFASLGLPEISQIATREMQAVARRSGLRARGIQLDLDDTVVPWLAKHGCDPQYGARPLKRAVATSLIAPLARHLSGSAPPRVSVRAKKSGLVFKNAESESRANDDASLRALVSRCSELRWLAGTWRTCRPAISLQREVELADRMMQSKRFWRDDSAARSRSAAVAPLRGQVERLQAVHEEANALEELAHERWRTRDCDGVSALEAAAQDIETALSKNALELDTVREHPDDLGRLRFWADEENTDFGQQLIETYVRLGESLGWSMTLGKHQRAKFAHVDTFLRKTRSSKFPQVLVLKGPGVRALLGHEAGAHDRRTDSEPQRVLVNFSVTSNPTEPEPTVVRQYDSRKRQLRATKWRTHVTLGANATPALLSILRLGVCCRVLGIELGTRVWKGSTWS